MEKIAQNNTLIILKVKNTNNLIEYTDSLIQQGYYILLLLEKSINERSIEDKYNINILNKSQEIKIEKLAKEMNDALAFKIAVNTIITKNYQKNFTNVIFLSDTSTSITDITEIVNEEKEQVILVSKTSDITILDNIKAYIFNIFHLKKIKSIDKDIIFMPIKHTPIAIDIKKDNYFYQRMLVNIVKNNLPVEEVFLDNIKEKKKNYLEEIKKINVILEDFYSYSKISFLSYLVDINLFRILFIVSLFLGIGEEGASLFISTFLARIIASFIHFYINKKERKQKKNTLPRYIVLTFLKTFISLMVIYLLFLVSNINIVIAKIIIDFLIYILTYSIFNIYVFRYSKEKYEKKRDKN